MALVLLCAAMVTWMSCGTTESHFLYAAAPAASQILVYREDPNSGVLTALSGSPYAAGPAVQALAIHPSKKFLYAANSGESDISLFTLDATGAPTEVTPRTVVGTSPSLMEMDPGGAFLYVASSGSNGSISAFSIDSSSGALTVVAGSPFSIGIFPLNMKLSPSGGFLYVTGATSGTTGVIEAFAVTAGVLTVLNTSPFVTGPSPYGLAIDPAGAHLYTANTLGNSISEFTINSDGSLTQLAGSPIGQTYLSPLALLVDPSGKYLYGANEGSSNLGAYAIGSDGSLTLLTNSPFVTGAQPNLVVSDPSGKYLFVGNQSSAAIQSFSLDSTGTLTSVASYSTSNTPSSIVISP
jgi:6-phosphogluconolactonase (cycloisomerase 2 family)